MAHVPEVEAKPWDDFLSWFRGVWKPGEHLAAIAPTGAGKSTFVVGVLQECRRFVLAFDPKGGDSTLRGSAWPRMPTWPPHPQVYEDIDQGKEARFIVGPATSLTTDDTTSRHQKRNCITTQIGNQHFAFFTKQQARDDAAVFEAEVGDPEGLVDVAVGV